MRMEARKEMATQSWERVQNPPSSPSTTTTTQKSKSSLPQVIPGISQGTTCERYETGHVFELRFHILVVVGQTSGDGQFSTSTASFSYFGNSTLKWN